MDSEEDFLLDGSERAYIIIGAGGHAKVIVDILTMSNKKIYGFFDDYAKILGEQTFLGPVAELNQWTVEEKKKYKFLIAIGDCIARKRIAEEIDLPNELYGKAIHPNASIAEEALIGQGTVVMANAVINVGSSVGEHCIINSASVIEHDCKIKPFVHISPGVCLAGGVKIGTGSHVGIGAQCIQLKNIGDWCTIGAGSTIVGDIPAHTLSYGSPAKIMKEGINLEF